MELINKDKSSTSIKFIRARMKQKKDSHYPRGGLEEKDTKVSQMESYKGYRGGTFGG